MIPVERRPLVGVGTVIYRADRESGVEVVLIRRGRAPRIGEWSLPGGRQDWGETVRAAAIREAREETGLNVEILGLIDVVDSLTPAFSKPAFSKPVSPTPAPGLAEFSHHYTLIDFAAVVTSGTLVAGSDAADARWVPLVDLPGYALWDETLRIIRAGRRFLESRELTPSRP